MQSGNYRDVEPRFGDWGPAYIIQGPTSDIGLLTLRPGDKMTNHIHHFCDESFVVLEGRATLWFDCEEQYSLRPGDVYRAAPGEMHYFINDHDEVFKMIFIKSPASPNDTVNLPWQPGQPIPQVPNTPQQ